MSATTMPLLPVVKFIQAGWALIRISPQSESSSQYGSFGGEVTTIERM
jgi:hypothetical protein